MNIVHLTNNLTDGAGKAVYKIHKGLLELGDNSKVLVAKKEFLDNSVKQVVSGYSSIDNPIKNNKDLIKRGFNFISFLLKEIKWKLLHRKWNPSTLFNFNKAYVSINKLKNEIKDADIICLYSIQSFLSSKIINEIYNFTEVPIVWTPMDIEPITGGCHFNNSCENYYTNCGNCPLLTKPSNNDISKKIFKEKKKYLYDLPITFVAVSNWVKEWIQRGFLFKNNRIEKIFLGIDNSIFKKINKEFAREVLSLPKDKKLILFGCLNLDDERKGGSLLLKSLNEIDKNEIDKNEIVLVTIGRKNTFEFDKNPFDNIHLGLINNDRILSLLYNAVDVVAVPSIDDPGPLMVSETIMCKTPVVTFNVGIATEIITNERIGYKAENFSVIDYSKGLLHYLTTDYYEDRTNDKIIDLLSTQNQAKEYKLMFDNILLDNNK